QSHRALSEHKTPSISWSHYLVALIWLLTNRRLRACFNEEKE
ncbi:hypothetical protein OCN69_16755, partial [Escherichia coli]|nr:hypothetical protein [Escherichia coli]